jgi:hypothetical protein
MGHVGTTNIGFEGLHVGFGYGDRNQDGNDILDFAVAYDLLVANTFRKKRSHLVIFSSAQHSSQIDIVLTRRLDRRACLYCKVIPGECAVPQHKLVVDGFRMHVTKACVLWKLKEEAQQSFKERMMTEGPWDQEGGADSMWLKMATCIPKVAREVLGVTKGNKHEAKDTW